MRAKPPIPIVFMLVAPACGLCAKEATIEFEAASVKPCERYSPEMAAASEGSPGRVRLLCRTAESLVRDAFVIYGDRSPVLPSVRFGQLRGPAWIRSDRFTIEAKASGGAPLELMKGPMMQALLRDRFGLRVHRETVEIPIYRLELTAGARIRPSPDGSCTTLTPETNPSAEPVGRPVMFCGAASRATHGGLDFHGMTVAELCTKLSYAMDRDLVDATGLKGVYDIHLDLEFSDIAYRSDRGGLASVPVAGADEPGMSISGALRRAGFKVVPGKTTVSTIVIDHIEKPGPN